MAGRDRPGQALAGAKSASLQSAGEIGDDRTRAGALRGAAAAPPTAEAAPGGAAEPDFDSLIDLIKSTVKPTSWDDVGGAGSISPFPTGVWVDPRGVLHPASPQPANEELAALRSANRPRAGQEDVRRASPMRMVSLPRLEKCVQLRLAAGQPPTEAMQMLAGLYRIRCVFIYPDSGDIVLAGPAGDWTPGPEGTILSAQTAQPVLRLDDLVVVFRSMMRSPDAKFGCWIMPREENLARLQKFLERSQKRPINAEFRGAWLDRLREEVGKQDIEVYGLDPRTRAARVIVAADYRMKLVGMGLEEGVPGVQSYLKSIKLAPGQPPPPMTVLRWWFTLNYDPPVCSRDRLAFALRGQGVKVESENEHLTAQGKQVHTGDLRGALPPLRPQLYRALRGTQPQVPDLWRVAEPVRAGDGRGPAAQGGRRGPRRLAPDLLRRSGGLRGGNGRRRQGSRFGRRLPGHQPQDHRGGRERWGERPAAVSVRQQSIGTERDGTLENQRSGAGENNRKLPEGRWWWD